MIQAPMRDFAVALSVGATIRRALPSPTPKQGVSPAHTPVPALVVHHAASSLWPVTVPTWISALATLGLLIGAILLPGTRVKLLVSSPKM